MTRTRNGFLFAAIVLLTATSQAQGQTNDLMPPIDTNQHEAINRLKPQNGHPFLPLINDVIERAFYQSGTESDQPNVRTCQLNAPLPFESETNDPNCNSDDSNQTVTVGGWVVSKMHVTPELQIQYECPSCEAHCNETSSCESDSIDGFSHHSNVAESSTDDSIDQYCEQVAAMLITTLNGSKDNPPARKRAIQTALKMVAEKTNLMAQAEADKLQESHQQSLKQILLEHARKGQSGFVSENKSVLEPIYATQFRNSQQLKHLNDTNQSIVQSLSALEKKFASFTMMQRAKLSPAEVQRMMESMEAEKARENELEMLQAELQALDQRILQLQANPVRPANHLEPIYYPSRPLKPMTYPYNRSR